MTQGNEEQTAVVVAPSQQMEQVVSQELSVQDVVAQVAKIQQVMARVMKEGEHFGKVPGCGDKPTLLQPGAQKLMLTFRLIPERQIETIDLGYGHREVRVKTRLLSPSGEYRGEGVGVCSTMESKYRFRTGPKEMTGQGVPKEYWDTRKTDPAKAQAMIGGPGYSVGKNDLGFWEICIQGEKVEHDNPADYWNTVTKIACKRADVHAAISTTAASDIFTQDLEDLLENGVLGKQAAEPKPGSKQSVSQPQRKQNGAKKLTDAEAQEELLNIVTTIAQAGKSVTTADYKTFSLVDASEEIEPDALACQVCAVLSSFQGRNGVVQGKPDPKQLAGTSLGITLKKAQDVLAGLQQAA